MSDKPWYLAGPMTGIPQFNFPAFEAAAKLHREAGLNIISPHEMDSPAVQEAAWASKDGKLEGGMVAGETWGDILARDVKAVADDAVGIIVLPGWQKSRGARLETFVAFLCGKPILNAGVLSIVDKYTLFDAWEGMEGGTENGEYAEEF